jgi:hypothetical protein
MEEFQNMKCALDNAHARIQELTTELIQREAELKRERFINSIAVRHIPADNLLEYHLACPNRQPDWTNSSPVPSGSLFY